MRAVVRSGVEDDSLGVGGKVLQAVRVRLLGLGKHFLDDQTSHGMTHEYDWSLSYSGLLKLLQHVLRPLLEALFE